MEAFHMFKREITEIKKTMSPQECNISRIRGCCVNGEKEILSSFGDTFLSLPEEEVFKYYEIFKKTLSGKIGKNVHNLDIPPVSYTHLDVYKRQILIDLKNQKPVKKIRIKITGTVSELSLIHI